MNKEFFAFGVFDGNPSESGPCEWPETVGMGIDSPASETMDDLIARCEAWANAKAVKCDAYDDGDRLWIIVEGKQISFNIDFSVTQDEIKTAISGVTLVDRAIIV